jgi:hypothetical protein
MPPGIAPVAALGVERPLEAATERPLWGEQMIEKADQLFHGTPAVVIGGVCVIITASAEVITVTIRIP